MRHLFLAAFALLTFAGSAIASAQPYQDRLREQCKTLEGRQQWIDSLDDISRRDLGYQAQGAGISYEEHLANSIEELCANIDTPWPEAKVSIYDPNYGYFEPKGQLYCTTDDEDERCDETYPVRVPDGYQACKFEHTAERIRSGSYEVKPAFFYPDDRNIARFKGWMVHIKARAYENRRTGVIIKNAKIWVLPDHYTDEQRRQFDCERPVRPAAAPTPPPVQPRTAPPVVTSAGQARVELVVNPSNRNNALLVVTHLSGGPATVYVEVSAQDAGYPNFPRSRPFYGAVTVQPGAVFREGVHVWRARDWAVSPGTVR